MTSNLFEAPPSCYLSWYHCTDEETEACGSPRPHSRRWRSQALLPPLTTEKPSTTPNPAQSILALTVPARPLQALGCVLHRNSVPQMGRLGLSQVPFHMEFSRMAAMEPRLASAQGSVSDSSKAMTTRGHSPVCHPRRYSCPDTKGCRSLGLSTYAHTQVHTHTQTKPRKHICTLRTERTGPRKA